MFRLGLLATLSATILTGCVSTYGYQADQGGDYYYAEPSLNDYDPYGGPYSSIGYGYPSGWYGSFGGTMTALLVGTASEYFHYGIAGGGVYDWMLYDTHYTERYMSTPQANAEGYAASDVIPRLPNMTGRLLLMHGMADDNVILENTTRVIDALQVRSVPFELMLYPGQRHGVRGNERQLQQWRTYLDFLDRTIGSRAPSAD